MATSPIAERRNRQDYLATGLAVLADGGVQGLTISTLCRRLGVTKGSFYHHFASTEAFRVALLDHWAINRTEELRQRIEQEPDPLARIGLLKDAAVSLEHEAESAIRAWARTDPAAARTQAAVDAVRENALYLAFLDLAIAETTAATLARLGLTILVGTQQLEDRVDRPRLTVLLDEYQHWVLDAIPK